MMIGLLDDDELDTFEKDNLIGCMILGLLKSNSNEETFGSFKWGVSVVSALRFLFQIQ